MIYASLFSLVLGASATASPTVLATSFPTTTPTTSPTSPVPTASPIPCVTTGICESGANATLLSGVNELDIIDPTLYIGMFTSLSTQKRVLGSTFLFPTVMTGLNAEFSVNNVAFIAQPSQELQDTLGVKYCPPSFPPSFCQRFVFLPDYRKDPNAPNAGFPVHMDGTTSCGDLIGQTSPITLDESNIPTHDHTVCTGDDIVSNAGSGEPFNTTTTSVVVNYIISTTDTAANFAGELLIWGGSNVADIPAARGTFIQCDGQTFDVNTHPMLFAKIGYHFGGSAASGTYKVPDCRGRIPVGTGQGSGLPEYKLGELVGSTTSTIGSYTHTHGIDGQSSPTSESGSGLGTTSLKQPSIGVNFAINVDGVGPTDSIVGEIKMFLYNQPFPTGWISACGQAFDFGVNTPLQEAVSNENGFAFGCYSVNGQTLKYNIPDLRSRSIRNHHLGNGEAGETFGTAQLDYLVPEHNHDLDLEAAACSRSPSASPIVPPTPQPTESPITCPEPKWKSCNHVVSCSSYTRGHGDAAQQDLDCQCDSRCTLIPGAAGCERCVAKNCTESYSHDTVSYGGSKHSCRHDQGCDLVCAEDDGNCNAHADNWHCLNSCDRFTTQTSCPTDALTGYCAWDPVYGCVDPDYDPTPIDCDGLSKWNCKTHGQCKWTCNTGAWWAWGSWSCEVNCNKIHHQASCNVHSHCNWKCGQCRKS